MFRRFGTLADLSSRHVGKAVDYFRSLSLEEKLKAEEDLPAYATQLIMYGGTTQPLEELKNFSTNHLKKPIILYKPAKEPLNTMLENALSHKSMVDLDIAIHFLWHNFQEVKFPYKKILKKLLPLQPIGSTENKELWRKLTSEMFYYACPDYINEEDTSNFTLNYSDQPYAYPALAKMAHKFEDVRATKLRQEVSNLRKHYLNSLEKTFIDKKNYELAKGYIKNLFEMKEPARVEIGFLSSLFYWATYYQDSEFIFQAYEKQSLINRGNQITELYAHTMYQISLLDLEGEYIPVMDKIISRLKFENPNYYKEFVFANKFASEAMVRSYIKDGRYEDAVVFMYDLNRLGCKLPYNCTSELAQLAFKDKKARVIQMIQSFDHTLSYIEMNSMIMTLREEMDKNGELLEKRFAEDKYYTQSSKYLIPMLLCRKMPVKGVIGEEDNFVPYFREKWAPIDSEEDDSDMEEKNERQERRRRDEESEDERFNPENFVNLRDEADGERKEKKGKRVANDIDMRSKKRYASQRSEIDEFEDKSEVEDPDIVPDIKKHEDEAEEIPIELKD
ncbi:unnamed protein product [Blepharisma stoltei]|uniref:Uncharacterized protein n=1 Tax=Blepharisma stoltei TaxID=1481888 RepID=A0AAU9JWP8_9CILI|nr:unnamed protein product [Blepharisma stoltei]